VVRITAASPSALRGHDLVGAQQQRRQQYPELARGKVDRLAMVASS
jgi:hypothetical protein